MARLSGHFEHQKGMEEHGGDAAEGPEIHGPLQLLGRDGLRYAQVVGGSRNTSDMCYTDIKKRYPKNQGLAILFWTTTWSTWWILVDLGVAKSVDPTE